MDSDVKNKVEYIIAVISEFAAAHSLNTIASPIATWRGSKASTL